MKISKTFAALKKKNEPALILFYTAGFPNLEESFRNIQILADNGADIIEIGIPFSDPLADGPVIQEASNIALENGASLEKIIKGIKQLSIDLPLVIMSYLNPLTAYGRDRFCSEAGSAGISGIIIPDLPVEAAGLWKQSLRNQEIDLIFLAAPNSTDERIKLIAGESSGFIYAVSLTGTTGMKTELNSDLGFIDKIKSASNTPVALGFGISNEAHIREAGQKADGIIIGSRLIHAVKNGEDLTGLVTSFKKAAAESRKEKS